jgi:biotin carboxyl carrier protein
VEVQVGDTVSAGDRLVVLEAMKMEHPGYADLDGAVAELRVAPGDQVRAGDLLVRVEPS